VIVLHVHEFAVGRFGRIQVDCAEGQGESLVASIVEDLRQSGLTAKGVITDADNGYVARAILLAARHHQARLLVLGSSSRTDLPWVPFGSVANRLLHIASLPVLIVPMGPAETVTEAAAEAASVTEAAPAG
jgi:nucleotide-binding universal stress UspA family protein